MRVKNPEGTTKATTSTKRTLTWYVGGIDRFAGGASVAIRTQASAVGTDVAFIQAVQRHVAPAGAVVDEVGEFDVVEGKLVALTEAPHVERVDGDDGRVVVH